MSRATLVVVVAVSLAGPGSDRAACGAFDTRVDAEARADAYVDGAPSEQGWFTATYGLSGSISPRAAFSVVAVLERDSAGDVSRDLVYDPRDLNLRRALIRFDELKLRLDLGSLDVEVGRQKLAWGRTDGINATDNLAPRDWTDPLDDERLSPWAVRADLERGRFQGELVVVPSFAPSRLPRLHGRWLQVPRTSVENPAFPAIGPRELLLNVEPGDAHLPPTTFRNVQRGVKAGRRGSRAEWMVSYYRGFDDAPRFEAAAGMPDLVTGIVPVALERRYPELQVSGGDGVLIAGAWALRGEAGYFHYEEPGADGYLLYQAEAEWTRGTWRAIVGYADDAGRKPPLAPPLAGGLPVSGALDQAFLPALIVHVSRAAPTEWDGSVEAAVGTQHKDYRLRLSGSLPVLDTLRVGAELDVLGGPETSFFGRWRDADRVRLFARLSLQGGSR